MRFSAFRACLMPVNVMAVIFFSDAVDVLADHECRDLPSKSDLLNSLASANNPAHVQIWAMIVANDGSVCAEALIGNVSSIGEPPPNAPWSTSRAISPDVTAQHDDNKHHDTKTDNRTGGIDAFVDGLPLYDAGGTKLGGIAVVSSDTSCHHRTIIQQTRHNLGLNFAIPGVGC